MPGQPCGPGNGKNPQELCSHRGTLAGVGSAELTTAAGNAVGTPSPEQHVRQ